MNILCTICARKGSKGLRNKNIKFINKKPLILYTIEQAISSKVFKHIVVSTDCKKIQKIAVKNGCQSWFLRSKNLSGDKVSKIDVIKNAFKLSEKKFNIRYDFVVDLDVTSPLRNIKDIKDAVSLFENKKYDNLISVCNSRKNPYFNILRFFNKKLKPVINKKKFIRRQDAPKTFDANASIYIWKRKIILQKKTLFNKNTGIYVMPQSRSIDIDNKDDFDYVKYYLEKRI